MIHHNGQVVIGTDIGIFELDGSSRVTDWFYPETAQFSQDHFDHNSVMVVGGAAIKVIGLAAGADGRTYANTANGLLALSNAGKKLWELAARVMD